MTGHPHDGLIWAPDPRDDLAFTLYAIDSETQDLKDEVSAYIASLGTHYASLEDMINDLRVIFPDAKHIFSLHDWSDIFESQF